MTFREEKNEAETQRRQTGGRDNAIYKHLTGFLWTWLKAWNLASTGKAGSGCTEP